MGVVRPRLRALHVITDLDVGGAERMLVALAKAHEPDIEHVVVSLLTGGALAPELRRSGVAVHEFAFRSPRAPLELVGLARLIRRLSPHVVQGWMYHGDLAAWLALTLSGLRHRTALSWGIRCSDMDLAQYSSQLRGVVRACALLSAKADVVTANSKAGLDWHLRHGYAPRRTLVLPNGIDIDLFRPDPEARCRVRAELGLSPDAFVAAHVARVDPMKDHSSFLAAMALIPATTALLIGAGTERLPDKPGVRRLGRRDDIPDLLAASDIVVSSSAFGEGFCNALAEGMACGLPAVATDVGDARLLLGDTGLVVPPRNPPALANAILSLRSETLLARATRGVAARQRVVQSYSLAAARARFHDLYRELRTSGVAR